MLGAGFRKAALRAGGGGLLGAACLTLGACGSSGRTPASSGDGNPPATFTDEQRGLLATLSPDSLPPPAKDASNRFADDPKAAAFGQRLFFDPLLSGALLDGDNDGSAFALGRKGETAKVACSGCHLPRSGFSDSRTVRHQISLAAGWGRRRAPSLLDVGHSTLLMWDGRFDTLYNQIFGVIEAPVEMNSSRLYAATQVFAKHRSEYQAIFGDMPPLDDTQRFPALTAEQTGCRALDAENQCKTAMRGAPGDGAEFDAMSSADQTEVTRVVVNVGKALGAYERLLDCGLSRFDRWMHGEAEALTRAEQRGAALFVGKGRCVECHSGPYLSDEKFHNVGLKAAVVATTFFNPEDPGAAEGLPQAQANPLNAAGQFSDGDDGRVPKDVDQILEGAFRTPRLRCVAGRPSFMHTGQMLKLEDVVAFFDRGGDRGGYLGKNELSALKLNPYERSDLVAFLQALDGAGPAEQLLVAPP